MLRRLYTFAVFIVLASLDNAAAGVLPPLYAIISRDFETSDAALGAITAVYVLVAALSAAFWGYRGDRGQRKRLLFFGTLFWATAMIGSGMARNLTQFLIFQTITAVGVGSISSVGFSVISDYIPFNRRGMALSLWSMSQVLGGAGGALLASTLGAYNWRWPFFTIAAVGLLFAILYLFTRPPQRGHAEPELAPLFAAGQTYDARIKKADLPHILKNRSNMWLLIQAFLFSLAYGSTFWVPRWAIARVQAEGFSLETATIVGNLFVTLFGLGLFVSIPAGYLGDKWQKRNPNGRANLAAIGLLLSIPFYILLYFWPLHNVIIPENSDVLAVTWAVFVSLFTNGWVASMFFIAFIALALFSFEAPNWAALITDVNLPEHRGTTIGISRIFRAVGNAFSVGLAGILFTTLTAVYTEPTNYAVGLVFFMILAVPASLCYIFARKYIPQDIAAVRATLTNRASTLAPSSSASPKS